MKKSNFTKKGHRILTVSCLLVFMMLLSVNQVFAGGQTDSSEDGIIEVKMSYNGSADVVENAVHFYAVNFKRLVAEKTGNKIDIILYPNSQLGDEDQRMEQVMNDPIMNIASYAGIGTVFPELYAATIPFLLNSYDAGRLFFEDSEYWNKSKIEFQKRLGVELAEVVEEGGFVAFTNSKKPIHGPSDFKGMMFRAMDDSQVALYKSFGASGTPVPWTEVYTALQTGVADGQMNPPMYIIMGSLYEVQKYMILANVQYSMQYLLINGEWMNSLSNKLQKAIREAASEAKYLTMTDVEARVEERVKFIEDSGVEVYYPTASELDDFRRIGQPGFIKWLEEQFDKEWVDICLESAEIANKKAAE